MHWLTLTHTQRWHAHYKNVGHGHLYHGRFKSFPIQEDNHLLTVIRYVERNPLRAGLVTRAEEWRWSSLVQWLDPPKMPWLDSGPVPRPAGWLAPCKGRTRRRSWRLCGGASNEARRTAASWMERTARLLGLESSVNESGRPFKKGEGAVEEGGLYGENQA
jgi:putative transposase